MVGIPRFRLGSGIAFTNNHRLFDRDARFLSHGCVRVPNALDLAAHLLRDEPDWTLAAAGMLLLLMLYTAAAYALDAMHVAYM